jgi:predicted transcriptional regulator of viral defense system
MRQKLENSIPSQISRLPLVNSGNAFSVDEVAEMMDLPRNIVASAIYSMVDRNDVDRVSQTKYRVLKRHWINQIRLAGGSKS